MVVRFDPPRQPGIVVALAAFCKWLIILLILTTGTLIGLNYYGAFLPSSSLDGDCCGLRGQCCGVGEELSLIYPLGEWRLLAAAKGGRLSDVNKLLDEGISSEVGDWVCAPQQAQPPSYAALGGT